MRQRTCVSAAMFTILVRLGVTLLMIGVTVADRAQGAEPNAVRLRQLPDGHIQPMARVDTSGTVRGAHLALGTGGRPHVAWMGSDRAEPRGPDGQSPMLYSRLDDHGEFEPQRNLVTHAFGLDGGGTVAADTRDRVSVLWHADAGEGGEERRRVWMTRSADGGAGFWWSPSTTRRISHAWLSHFS